MLSQWILVDAAHRGEYFGPELSIIDSSGRLLYPTSGAREGGALWLGAKAVRFGLHGVVLDGSIPDPRAMLPSRIAAQYAADFAPDERALDDLAAWGIHADDRFTGFSIDISSGLAGAGT